MNRIRVANGITVEVPSVARATGVGGSYVGNTIELSEEHVTLVIGTQCDLNRSLEFTMLEGQANRLLSASSAALAQQFDSIARIGTGEVHILRLVRSMDAVQSDRPLRLQRNIFVLC